MRIVLAAQQLFRGASVDMLDLAAVCTAAGVSRDMFYDSFADREELLLAVFDDVTQRAGTAMNAARQAQTSWLDGVRAALIELLNMLDENPRLGGFIVAGSLTGDEALLARRTRALACLVDALEDGSPLAAAEPLPAPFGGEAVVGAVISILHGRLLEQPVPPLLPMCGSLMSVIVLSYLGVEAARQELTRPLAPQSRGAGVHLSAINSLSGAAARARARTTPRTMQLLSVIGERPGIGSRDIAFAVGIRDPGQVSRLLARLKRLGLIAEGTPERSATRKAWRLTAAGADLLEEGGSSPLAGVEAPRRS
jgi:AcrR family transcriptional regulator/DNA-binding MarR family transcriptional regulator